MPGGAVGEGKYLAAAGLVGEEKKHQSSLPSWHGPQQSGGVAVGDGDPFVTKLSGKAVSFAPAVPSGLRRPVSFMPGLAEADEGPLIVSSNGDCFSAKRPDIPAAVGPRVVDGEVVPTAVPAAAPGIPGVFTTDVGPGVVSVGGHYTKVEFSSIVELEKALRKLYEDFEWEKKLRGCVVPVNTSGKKVTLYLSFDDIRNAAKSLEQAITVDSTCKPSYITQPEYAYGKKLGEDRGKQEPTSFYDGQLILEADFRGHPSEIIPHSEGLAVTVTKVAKSFGPIISIVELASEKKTIRKWRVEFRRLSDADFMALSVVKDEEAQHKMWWYIVAKEMPEIHVATDPSDGKAGEATPQKVCDGKEDAVQFASPTGRTSWVLSDKGEPIAVPGTNQLPKISSIQAGISLTPCERSQHSALLNAKTPMPDARAFLNQYSKTAPQPRRRHVMIGPTRIDEERIINGIDVRTTIMVRNIPNDMTLEQLKEVIDKVLFGRYDFIYLRFDFNKNTNVGYAFVNFLTPGDLLAFVKAYDGKEFIPGMGAHPTRGPRLAEFAYATVQGQDCAIEKFRNSSIMCEFAGYRPKLFYSIADAPNPGLIGEERPFPAVNNMSKHNRSKDNAGQIGLYAPKSHNGAMIVRNSQFDRGTPAQMHEDAMFHQQQMMQNAFAYGYGMPNFPVGSPTMQMPYGMPGMPFATPYGSPNVFNSPFGMNGSPYAVQTPPSNGSPCVGMPTAFNGSPGNSQVMVPSRLRTITQGRLSTGRRRVENVRPPRTYEEMIADVEETKRLQAEEDRMRASMDPADLAPTRTYEEVWGYKRDKSHHARIKAAHAAAQEAAAAAQENIEGNQSRGIPQCEAESGSGNEFSGYVNVSRPNGNANGHHPTQ